MSFLLINKPAGITSHDVVDRVRRVTGIRTVGHAGTLDPFATGLLIVGVERQSTKHLATFLGMDKTYAASIRIGATSTTLDPEGEVTEGSATTLLANDIVRAAKDLTGPLEQIPPMHSAIKIGGKKLYELARKGIEIDRPPREVTVHAFTITSSMPATITTPYTLEATISCSSGTYIRSLARDFGEKLGTTAYLTALSRTMIGPYSIDDAIDLSQLTQENWRGLAKNITP